MKHQTMKKPDTRTLASLKETAKDLESMILGSSELPSEPNANIGYKKLKHREILFIHEYIKEPKNIQAAAQRAGYGDPNYGYKLLQEDRIKNEIDRRLSGVAAVTVITKDYISAELISMFNEARNDDKQDRRTMLSCLDMIAKLNNFYAPAAQVNIQNNLSSIRIEIVKPEDTDFQDASE